MAKVMGVGGGVGGGGGRGSREEGAPDLQPVEWPPADRSEVLLAPPCRPSPVSMLRANLCRSPQPVR